MAGDWIKLEHATLDKPEILELAELLSVTQGDALLLCLRFWVWADQQSTDGRLVGRSNVDACVDACVDRSEFVVRSRGVSKKSLDALMRCSGFSEAVIYVGWMREHDGILEIVNFDRHCGENAKKRALRNRAQANWRRGAGADVDAHVDQPVDAPPSTNASTREEKRRVIHKRDKVAVPDGWEPKATTLTRLAAEQHLSADDLRRYIPAFHDSCRANNYRYSDFDAAFSNCVRQDWPRLRQGGTLTSRKVASG